MGPAEAAAAIRPAATVILWRCGDGGPEVLMGRRGAQAAFMPSKWVFPGGAVDAADAAVPLAGPLDPAEAARLALDADGATPRALAAAAVRELWEEAGLALGRPGDWPAPPAAAGADAEADAGAEWARFAARGLVPDAAALRFVFRAVTPPGRARRFDARFFLADAAALHGGAEAPSGELQGLAWVPLAEAARLDIPFVTEVALAEAAALLRGEPQPGVPFFDNRGDRPLFRRLG